MGRVRTLARRTFLIGSAAIAGGVAFGAYMVRKPHDNPLDGVDGAVALTPYVLIDQGGVTLITPRADTGQGVTSVLAALLAEELDIDWQDIRTDHGPPAAAYYNTVVAAEGLPVAATDTGLLAEGARGFGQAVSKLIGLQITGGSTSVPDAYEKMRAAGASARETLKAAAAERLGVARETLSTQSGAVISADGQRLAYTGLAVAAADLAPVTDVPLRDPATWRYLGKETQRVDIVDKSSGTAGYGIDLSLPDMLHATVRMAPFPSGTVASVDTSTAEAMRGIERIIPLDGGMAVLADNTWRAFQAADALDITWSAPPNLSNETVFAGLAEAITADTRDSRFRDDGDVDAASLSVDVEYRVPFLAHAPLEPMNATARLRDGKLDLWTSTQVPLFLRDRAADLAGLEKTDVAVHVLPGGGSFGRRLEFDFALQAVSLAREVPGRPVKLTWSREEDMAHDFPRPACLARGRGAVANGQVTAFDLGIAAPSVAASQTGRLGLPAAGPDVAIVAGAWDQPFALPDYRVTGYRGPETVGVSSWRSVGASANAFFHESLLDELIHGAGADPLEERLRLVTDPASRAVLEAVGDMSDWGSALPEGHGRGLAFCISFGVPVAEVVEVDASDGQITLTRAFAVAELGRVLDPINCENQMQGGLIWGLGHAIGAELTYEDGQVLQSNFHDYPSLRMYQCPEIEVRALETTDRVRGIGEPTVPPAAPALANAIFAATGQRIRSMPLWNEIGFI